MRQSTRRSRRSWTTSSARSHTTSIVCGTIRGRVATTLTGGDAQHRSGQVTVDVVRFEDGYLRNALERLRYRDELFSVAHGLGKRRLQLTSPRDAIIELTQ